MVANGIYNYREVLDAEGKSYSPKRWDCYINVPGMKRPKHKRFRGTKRDCGNFCMRIRREAESGIRPDAEKVTVAEFMGDYLRNRQAMGEFADSTIARYDWLLRKWIAPYIGGVPVKDVSPSMVERWYRKASSDGASGTTLNKAHRLAKMAFKNAVRDGLATSNKFDQVKAPKSEENKRGYLSFEEAGRMLNVLDEEEGFSGFSAAVRIGLAIGARRGEVLALTWNDIVSRLERCQSRRALFAYQERGRRVFRLRPSKRPRPKIATERSRSTRGRSNGSGSGSASRSASFPRYVSCKFRKRLYAAQRVGAGLAALRRLQGER